MAVPVYEIDNFTLITGRFLLILSVSLLHFSLSSVPSSLHPLFLILLLISSLPLLPFLLFSLFSLPPPPCLLFRSFTSSISPPFHLFSSLPFLPSFPLHLLLSPSFSSSPPSHLFCYLPLQLFLFSLCSLIFFISSDSTGSPKPGNLFPTFREDLSNLSYVHIRGGRVRSGRLLLSH